MSEYKSFKDEGQEGVVDPQDNSKSEIDQMFEDGEEAEKTEGVADPEPDEDEGQETEEETEEEEEEEEQEEEIEDQEQDPEQNRIYKNMRLKAQREAKASLEAEREKIENARIELEIARQEREAQQVENSVRSQMLTEENINNVEIGKGVTREIAVQLLEADAQKVIADERNKVTERYQKINEQKKNFKNDDFYSLIVDEVDKIVAGNPNVDFETAYKFTVGNRYQELRDKVNKKSSKKNNAAIQDSRRRRSVIKGDGGTSRTTKDILTNKGLNMAEAFGNDPVKIAARIRQARKKK